jgi:hypothetical protein
MVGGWGWAASFSVGPIPDLRLRGGYPFSWLSLPLEFLFAAGDSDLVPLPLARGGGWGGSFLLTPPSTAAEVGGGIFIFWLTSPAGSGNDGEWIPISRGAEAGLDYASIEVCCLWWPSQVNVQVEERGSPPSTYRRNSDHTESTVACVTADAPTLRCSRQARP